jgi:transposase
MIKMAQLEDIRKMYFMEGLSIREINRRTGIHRDTISKYISLEEPKPPKYKLTKERKHPVLGPYIPMIKQIIEEDRTRHRKQRHTGTKIFEILKAEGFTGGYNTVSDYLRKEYRKQREAFLPLEFELGTYAEVDWTEAYFYLKGKETKAHVFVMKLRGSGGFYEENT